jgi:transportin-1
VLRGRDHRNAAILTIFQMLDQAKSSPDINNYLALIFSSNTPPPGLTFSDNDYHLVRSAAAIMLKNNVKSDFKTIPEPSLALIKLAVPMGLQDKNSQIRSYAGNIATELIKRGGLYAWPELLPDLLKMLSNENGQYTEAAVEGGISAMAKICEDNTKILEREHNGQRPLNFILPKLIEATKSPLPKVRALALTAINVFTPRKSQAMLNSIDDLLQHLFLLAEDPSSDVRRQVCRAFVRLVETRPDKLLPHISGLVDYIISQQTNDDEELATEAAEFWLVIGEHDNLWEALRPYVHKIIPVLLQCMVYSAEDIAILGGASDDEDEEDREEDLKPQFASKKATRNLNSLNGDQAAQGANGSHAYEKLASMDDDLEEGEIDDLDEDEGDENPDERWTLRKCSAAALDVFARDFGADVFTSILPYLQANLRHNEWSQREAAVLALGAVADGCMAVVIPHLPELVPYLITLLNDPEVLVRQIVCWTLGRYSQWAASLEDPALKAAYFEPMMEGILTKMLDKNKKVQEAGASAMANLEEKAGKRLEPYLGPIIQQFVRCFAKYKDKNIYILYDCVQTMAESVGPVLHRPELSQPLMEALIERWNRLPDQARELVALLECLGYVAMALGDSFTPYAEPIFTRSVNIIHENLEQNMLAVHNADADPVNKDFLVTSLDLLSAVIQALDDDKSEALVKTQSTFFEMLTFCMQDPLDEVRQSAYALLGDCSKYVFEQLRPAIPTIMPILLKQLDLDEILDDDIDASFNVINNACWSAGEIAVKYKKAMEPYVQELLERLVEIVSNPRVPKQVNENAAVALGRLGLDNYDQLAPHLDKFAEEFLESMDDVDPSEEKASAFKGFSMVVGQNPQALEKTLLHYFTAIAKYRDLNLQKPLLQELHQVFQHVSRSPTTIRMTKCFGLLLTYVIQQGHQRLPPDHTTVRPVHLDDAAAGRGGLES